MAVKTSNLNIRIDSSLKEEAENIFSELGIPMSTAITMFLKSAIRYGGFPCELTVDPFYSKKNLERLDKSIAQIEAGKGTVHELIECDEQNLV